MNMIIPILTNLLIAFVTSHFAQKRGRDGATWFVVGVVLGIFGLLLLFLLPSAGKQETVGPIAKGPSVLPSASTENSSFSGWGSKPQDNGDLSLSEDKSEAPISKELAESREKDWYYVDEARSQQGPIPYEDLRLAVEREHVTKDSLVWCDGMSAWMPLGELAEVYADLDQPPA